MSDTESPEPQEATGAPEEGTEVETPAEPSEPASEPEDEPEIPLEGDEPEDEPEPIEGPDAAPSTEASLKVMDKRFNALERRATGYAQAVEELMLETEQPIVRCGFCLPRLPGFIGAPYVQPFTPDQLAFARMILGEPDVPPLVQAQDAHMCAICDGWGTVLTGSKKNNQKSRKCYACDGRGWEGRGAGEVQATNGSAGEVTLTAPEQAEPDSAARDPWGRTPDMPGYYVMPHPGMPAHELPPGMAQVAG